MHRMSLCWLLHKVYRLCTRFTEKMLPTVPRWNFLIWEPCWGRPHKKCFRVPLNWGVAA